MKAVKGITPYQAMFDKKPCLDQLRVFDCTAYVKVLLAHTKKLDDRSKKMVYLGVEEGSKAHCLFDPEGNGICVSRDVVFDENRKWSWEKEKGDSPV